MPFVLPPPPPAYVATWTPPASSVFGQWEGIIDQMDPAPVMAAEGANKKKLHPGVMRAGDVDLKLNVGFHGFSAGPLSLALAFVGWIGAEGIVEVGVLRTQGLTLALGAEAFYNRPWLVEFLATRLLNFVTPEGTWDFTLVHMGIMGRAALHVDSSKLGVGADGFDPYAVFLVGPDRESFSIEYSGTEGEGYAEITRGGLRVAPGLGFNFVGESGWMGNVELRYMIGMTFKQSTDIQLLDAEGEPLFAIQQEDWQRPPRGFSWIVGFGKRF